MANLFVLCLLVMVVGANCQFKIIKPTYRPPVRRPQPVIRTVRDVSEAVGHDQNSILSPVFEEMPNARVERSLGTPGRGRIGSNDRGHSGSRGQDTGATHPGYNRRNARSLHLPDFVTTPPFNPKPYPGYPRPSRPKFPIYV